MAEFKEGRSITDVCEALAKGEDVSRLVSFAKACEVAERYEDMVEAVKVMARALGSTKMTSELPRARGTAWLAAACGQHACGRRVGRPRARTLAFPQVGCVSPSPSLTPLPPRVACHSRAAQPVQCRLQERGGRPPCLVARARHHDKGAQRARWIPAICVVRLRRTHPRAAPPPACGALSVACVGPVLSPR